MEHAIEMWTRLDAVDAETVTALVHVEPYLMFKLVNALLSTAYFPLQQFYFMTLAGLLYWLQRSRNASDARALQAFVRSAQQFDAGVSTLLPLHESIDWVCAHLCVDRRLGSPLVY